MKYQGDVNDGEAAFSVYVSPIVEVETPFCKPPTCWVRIRCLRQAANGGNDRCGAISLFDYFTDVESGFRQNCPDHIYNGDVRVTRMNDYPAEHTRARELIDRSQRALRSRAQLCSRAFTGNGRKVPSRGLS